MATKNHNPLFGEASDVTAPLPRKSKRRSDEIERLCAKVADMAECVQGVRVLLDRTTERLNVLANEIAALNDASVNI